MRPRMHRPYSLAILLVSGATMLASCRDDGGIIPIPMTETFQSSLSTYGIFQGDPRDLIPASDVHELELSSSLFVNYAKKQRLVRLPAGTQMIANGSGTPTFPEGSTLVKTFYYYNDATNVSQGTQLIETRLLIKREGQWNVASYVWNDAQTDATLELNGADTNVSWTDATGQARSIRYHVPDEEECVSCHQSNQRVVPLGPTLRNMNLDVTRDGQSVNQLEHLRSLGLLSNVDVGAIATIVNYEDTGSSLADRGRAYLEMNCAHCHNPAGWRKPAEEGFDFRYSTRLDRTGIRSERGELLEAIQDGEMPYLGTTTQDREGINLMTRYLNSL